tara:strand:- start:82 stop:360 length:279 start_codon:yes stop_codon:yes gene_type:complete
MVAGCRTSGVLTASAIIARHQCKLISIHACELAGAAAMIKVYDGISPSGVEIARMVIPAVDSVEFDMHGVIAKNGLYFEKVSGDMAVSIEFQ